MWAPYGTHAFMLVIVSTLRHACLYAGYCEHPMGYMPLCWLFTQELLALCCYKNCWCYAGYLRKHRSHDTFDVLYNYFYIHIFIYICVRACLCVCVCFSKKYLSKAKKGQGAPINKATSGAAAPGFKLYVWITSCYLYFLFVSYYLFMST